MCRRVTCSVCKKPTWAGCGQHIEQALAGVPKGDRCRCTEAEKKAATGDGIFARLFGR